MRWAQFANLLQKDLIHVDLVRRDIKDWHYISMGLADVTFVDALISLSERHSAGIELIILIRKNLCSGFVSEEKSHEKKFFAEIKSLIFTKPKFTISLLYIDFLS